MHLISRPSARLLALDSRFPGCADWPLASSTWCRYLRTLGACLDPATGSRAPLRAVDGRGALPPTAGPPAWAGSDLGFASVSARPSDQLQLPLRSVLPPCGSPQRDIRPALARALRRDPLAIQSILAQPMTKKCHPP